MTSAGAISPWASSLYIPLHQAHSSVHNVRLVHEKPRHPLCSPDRVGGRRRRPAQEPESADPPYKRRPLNYMQGNVSIEPVGASDGSTASSTAPTIGESLGDRESRAERKPRWPRCISTRVTAFSSVRFR